MFDGLAGQYDFLNHFLSLGIDKAWRRKAIQLLHESKPKLILDIATGTGDMAIEAAKLNPEKIIGVDFSEKMLQAGRNKIAQLDLSRLIEMKVADSENLPFESQSFDAVTVAFGIRNFENPKKGLAEMARILKPGGRAVILEFSVPDKAIFAAVYRFYFSQILPKLASLFTKDVAAYKYLPRSVKNFPEGQSFLNWMNDAGFNQTRSTKLSMGIATIYIGIK